jgi:hypothetical protein
MTGAFRTSPLVSQMCAMVDRLFVEFIGPFGQMVIDETREKWQASGNKIRTSDVNDYIALLAKEIEDPANRTAFTTRARQTASAVHMPPSA